VAQGLRYALTGVSPTGWFSPSQPLPPVAQDAAEGRAFDYPAGANLRVQPRADEPIGFAQLRALADSYDLLRLVIETRKDQIETQRWGFRLRGETETSGAGTSGAATDPRIEELTEFFRSPDGEHSTEQWLRLLLEDLFVIDAPTIYIRRKLNGAVARLEVIDGATIKRLIDDGGRTPMPPDPAYQQVLKGLPAVDYSGDELIYAPRNLRPHKIYGFSPVEQIVLTINTGLRKAIEKLYFYTEGNLPPAMVGVPESWNPDQIRKFQAWFDELMAGDLAAKRRLLFVPGGMKTQLLKPDPLADEFDEWLARIVCFAFSVPPTPFVKQLNRATAQTAQEAGLDEGLEPLMRWVKNLIDRVIRVGWGYADIELVWTAKREPKPAEQAAIDQIYLTCGVLSVDEVRQRLGLARVASRDSQGGSAHPHPPNLPRGEEGQQGIEKLSPPPLAGGGREEGVRPRLRRHHTPSSQIQPPNPGGTR
jgi:hypothetical protein